MSGLALYPGDASSGDKLLSVGACAIERIIYMYIRHVDQAVLTDAVFVVAFSRDDGFVFTGSSSLFRASPKAAARCNAASYNGNLWIAAHKSSTFPRALQVELKQRNMFLLTLIENDRLESLG
jgi:hypothetical protein